MYVVGKTSKHVGMAAIYFLALVAQLQLVAICIGYSYYFHATPVINDHYIKL